ncbi:MAG TPA: hypothetical protein PLS00_12295, partial [Niabella sp.]|nr:hypothetical protein [Niabella sp.]
DIEEKLSEYALFLDKHRIMVLNYKMAILYFGSGDFSTCIDYIQRIINDRFQSGELDECPLTLRDLARIKES